MNDIYKQFALSVLRKLLTSWGAILVARGYAENDIVNDVVNGVALLLVSTAWSLWAIHREAVYARMLTLLGIAAPPSTPPAAVVADAKRALRQ
jgi:hypothetical protein